MKKFLLSQALFLLYTLSSYSQGNGWELQNPKPTGNSLLDVQFVDSQTGWAVGFEGIILKTHNGGSNWNSKNSGTTNILFSVHFIDAQTGWASGFGGVILKTLNGGNTWVNQKIFTIK